MQSEFHSPNNLALRGHFNASVACMTKQRGCSSEGMEETYMYVVHVSQSPFTIDGSAYVNS